MYSEWIIRYFRDTLLLKSKDNRTHKFTKNNTIKSTKAS